MNAFIRWGKFNVVGAMGMVVQLAALALFSRLAPGHYLYASAAAVELAVLHNFVWHVRYTWRDRRDGSALLSQIAAVSSFEWAGFDGGESCADARAGAWGHLPLLVCESDRDCVLLGGELLSGE